MKPVNDAPDYPRIGETCGESRLFRLQKTKDEIPRLYKTEHPLPTNDRINSQLQTGVLGMQKILRVPIQSGGARW
jgi:hypothetical protein